MIIVGEKINSSRKPIARAIEDRNPEPIREVARAQARAGAHYIDVNAGTFLDREAECLVWLVKTVQEAVDLPLCLDSPDPESLAQAMQHHRGEPLINSISLEEERFRRLLPLVASRPCRVVALCMTGSSLPTSARERVEAGSELVGALTSAGIPVDRIFVDPLVQPVSVDPRMGAEALDAIDGILSAVPGVHTICGLSNVSFGLPARRLVNRCFLILALARGLSAAILDPTDLELMATMLGVEVLLGRDAYCERYIEAYQDGRLP